MVTTKFGIMDRWEFGIGKGSCGCSPCKGILKYTSLFKEGLGFEVGDGRRIKFWVDSWCGERSLRLDFLDVFTLAMAPSSTVSDNYSVHRDEVI